MGITFIYVASVIIFVWGVAHIIPTKNVVRGFGQLSNDNRRIIIMEWVGEGLALCFIGLLATLVTLLGGTENPVSKMVLWACALMSLIMGGWTLLIGFKTSIIPIKICPLVLTIVAILFFVGSVI